MKDFEVIKYELFGLSLQEPVSLIYNWLVAILCLLWYFKMSKDSEFIKNWKYFFLTFAITSFVAGLAHSLYHYFGIYGKMPHWVGGIISGYFVCKAMLTKLALTKGKIVLTFFMYLKLLASLSLALLYVTFTFVLIDSALTYIVYCAGISFVMIKQGEKEYKGFVLGVLLSFCGAISFVFKLDISIYFNREDFSHIFVLASLIVFYLTATKTAKKKELITP
jgi:hypothetical protein